MNYGRLALAAVAAMAADMIYGYAVYGVALASQFAVYPGIFRPMEAINANMPLLVIGNLVGMFTVTYIYAKGYEGRGGAQEGLRFGVLIATFMVGYVAVGNYLVMNVGRRFAASMAAAGIVEWMIIGLTIGLTYKPSGRAARPAARV